MSFEFTEAGSLPGADGSFVGVAPDGTTIVVARRGRAMVWNDDELRHTVTIAGYNGGPIAFNPSDSLARLGTWTIDVETGAAHSGSGGIDLLTAGLEFSERAPSRFYSTGASAVTADGTRLATTFVFAPSKGIGDDVRNAGPHGQLVLIDPASGEFVAVLESTTRFDSDRVIAIDAAHVVAAGAGVGVWRASDGTRIGGLDGRPGLKRSDIRLSPVGARFAATRFDGTAEFGSLDAVDSAHVWTAHPGRATALAFHPAGEMLATGGDDQQVKLWTVGGNDSAELVGWYFVEQKVAGLAFDPTGDHLMIATGRNVVVVQIS